MTDTVDTWRASLSLNEALQTFAGQHASAIFELSDAQTGPEDESFAAARASQHAGSAVELLSKSILAREHPALILQKSFDALPRPEFISDLKGKRTKGAGELYALLSQHLALGEFVGNLGMSILHDRNQAVHLGYSAHSLGEVLDRISLWIYYIQESSGLKESDWLSSTASTAQSIRFNAFTVGIREAIEKARGNFERKKASIIAKHKKNAGSPSFTEWKQEREKFDTGPIELGELFEEICPACKSRGQIASTVDDVEYEYEGPDEVSMSVLYTFDFLCPVCDLKFDDIEVTFVFKVGQSWEELQNRFALDL